MSDLWNIANPQLKTLVAYEPGKPIEDVAREHGLDPKDIIKLASNENPLGPSPKAVAAMHDAIGHAQLYPDGGGFRLRNAIAEKFGLERANIILGNGSNEIIEFVGHAFLRPGDEVVTAQHAFVVYKLMATLFGATTVEVPDPGFKHDLDAMAAAITPRTRQVFIANPNNPTGTLCHQEEIDRFMDKVPDHVIVIFDEAYYEFLDEPLDTIKYVKAGRNVVIMRTFSKIQGLASLRIGYGIAPAGLADILQKTRQPFNANAIAQAGALAGLQDEDHIERTREVNRTGRDFIQSQFAALGLDYVPSFGNFVLVKVGDGDALFAYAMTRGIILRSMRAYGLPEYIRVSVGTMPQNEKFIEVLRGWLAG
jgi:histidinol-phosphate aminotransferase